MLKDKNIILGICGSIAAYKAASLIRLLVKEHANIQVIMTPDAANFITPLTLSTLSKRPVLTQYFDPLSGEWNNHVELGLWAHAMVIAPASANTIAKLSAGMCDNLLSAVYLSARCPVYVAPAMDVDMWLHPATRSNINKLKSAGNEIIPPGTGELASGLEGEGRMAEPEEIKDYLVNKLVSEQPFSGKSILISAGPTYEAIDPVRFIGNHSSGKMGFALAETFQKLGASVTLVSGPTTLQTPKNVKRIDITSAREMLDACTQEAPNADVIVMSAAVADYRPQAVAPSKIKKKEDTLSITLEKTNDILKSLGQQKKPHQILVGFALETDNELENAQTKLKEKNLDLIVLNSLKDKGAGFAGDTNKITILKPTGERLTFDLKSKAAVANDIASQVKLLISQKQ